MAKSGRQPAPGDEREKISPGKVVRMSPGKVVRREKTRARGRDKRDEGSMDPREISGRGSRQERHQGKGNEGKGMELREMPDQKLYQIRRDAGGTPPPLRFNWNRSERYPRSTLGILE